MHGYWEDKVIGGSPVVLNCSTVLNLLRTALSNIQFLSDESSALSILYLCE